MLSPSAALVAGSGPAASSTCGKSPGDSGEVCSTTKSVPAKFTGSPRAIRCNVSMPPEDVRREFERGAALRRRSLEKFSGEYAARVSQRAACNALHSIEKRLAVRRRRLTERLAPRSSFSLRDLCALCACGGESFFLFG